MLIALAGLPGSGKSTLAAGPGVLAGQAAALGGVRVSPIAQALARLDEEYGPEPHPEPAAPEPTP
jgi:hypothetical protein